MSQASISKKVKWSEVKVTQLHLTLCNPMNYSVHEILQDRVLEWAAYPFSSGSSWPRNWTGVSCIADGFFTSWATREAQKSEWHLLGLKNSQEWWFLAGGGQRQVAEPRPGEQSGTEASSLLSFSLVLTSTPLHLRLALTLPGARAVKPSVQKAH